MYLDWTTIENIKADINACNSIYELQVWYNASKGATPNNCFVGLNKYVKAAYGKRYNELRNEETREMNQRIEQSKS